MTADRPIGPSAGQPELTSLREFPAVAHLADAVSLLLDSRAPQPSPPFIHAPGTLIRRDHPESRGAVTCLRQHRKRSIVQGTADPPSLQRPRQGAGHLTARRASPIRRHAGCRTRASVAGPDNGIRPAKPADAAVG